MDQEIAVVNFETQEVYPVKIVDNGDGTYSWGSSGQVGRNAGVLHRNAITAADKLLDFANTDITTADNGAGTGSLNASTTYYATVIPGNRWGCCKVAGTINSQALAAYGANTGSIRLTFGQCAGADYYDLFLSTDAAPKWVARVTEAQRAAGDYEVTAVGTVAAGGGNPAGSVDVNVAGTGIQTSSSVFAQNNAWTPGAAGITAIDCSGRETAHVLVKITVTDLRSVPGCSVVPFFANQVSAADWMQGLWTAIAPLVTKGASLEQAFTLSVKGATGLKILCGDFAGQGTAVSVWVELS